MEKFWRLRKILAFMLGLIAFVYVGYILSQKGRYQPIPNTVLGVLDTQTGIIYLHSRSENVFYQYDSQNQSFKEKH